MFIQYFISGLGLGTWI